MKNSTEKEKTCPIAIISSGRSGSTLLQRIINSNDEFLISGEHGGLLAPLSKMWKMNTEDPDIIKFIGQRQKTVNEFESNLRNIQSWPAWECGFTQEDIQEKIKSIIEIMFNKNHKKTWGFKEIRYSKDDFVCEMIYSIYPSSRIIFLIRNPFHIIRSHFTTFHTNFLEKALSGNTEFSKRVEVLFENLCVDISKQLKNFNQNQHACNSIFLRYEDIANGMDGVFKKLEEFLGSPFKKDALDFRIHERIVSDKYDDYVRSLFLVKRHHVENCFGEFCESHSYKIYETN